MTEKKIYVKDIKTGDKVSEKPRFEFYKILPGGEAAQVTPAPAPPPTSRRG